MATATATTGQTVAAATETEEARPVRRRGPSTQVVLAIASLGAVMAFIDATIVNIAFPSIKQSFPGTPISSLSWVLNAYNIVFAAFLVAAGRIADLLGRRRTFVFGLELFSVASLACALAPSAGALIGLRVVQALGGALLVPSSLALVLNAFPPERRSHGVALLSAVSAAAAGIGPALGGLLVAADDWRLVFLVNIPIGAAAVVLARRRLVESRAPGRRRMPDVLGALVFAVAIAALVLGIVKGQEWGWGSPRIVGSFVVAAALGAVFAWRCTWHRSPVIDLALLRVRTFDAANGATVIAAAGYYGYTLLNVLFLTGVWHYSVLKAGLSLTPGPLVAVVVAGPISHLAQRIGHRPVLVAGGLIWGGAVLWFVEVVGISPDFLGQWLPGMALLGLGAGIFFPNISATAVASAPGESFATATGVNSVARQLGAALGVAVVVAILGTPSPLDALSAFHHAWTFSSACMFAAAIGCLLVSRVQVARAPSLGDAARFVLRDRPPQSLAPARPRARRAIRTPRAPAPAVRAESRADFLGYVPIFQGLDPALRDALAARARPVHVAAGEWLFHEGDPGDALYVVRAGRLEVVDESAGVTIRELGRGDALGELAILTGEPRSASVRAARESDLLAIDRPDFEALLHSSPSLSLGLTRVLAEQMRTTRAPVSSARALPATVALVSLHERVPAATLAARLTEALGTQLSVARLEREQPASAEPGVEPASVYGPLLDRAESTHDLVLLDAGPMSSGDPWTEFCLQQADRILAVTAGGPVPEALGDRPELRGCDLVAYDVVPGSEQLNGWAATFDPIESHLVRDGRLDEDLARLARRLSGRSVGVVLSGGGARAFSHIGVLEELLAAGIEIDRVAGVSMGAFIGAMFASGLDVEEIDARCFEEWVQRRPLSDYTVPRHSLIRGERLLAGLRRTFGELMIEELPRSFVCGSTELRSGRLMLSRHGLLRDAVAASICLPVIAAPRVRGGDLLIDGSLVDNLPVAAMADLAEGPIIAVDVKATVGGSSRDGSNSQPAAQRDGHPRRTPSLGETLARVLLLGSANTSEAARRHADLIINPHPPGVGLLEFHQLDAAREAGRQAAREALAQAPDSLFA